MALTSRPPLPDALRTLVEEFPRSGWDQPGRFQGLIRFWIEKHTAFRHLLETLQNATQGALDGADEMAFKQSLLRNANLLINELHGHHMIEDAQYFPILAQTDPVFAKGLKILDGDHHALDGQLQAMVTATNAVLQAPSQGPTFRDAAGRLEELFAETRPSLERHFIDEEDLVVPVLLKHEPAALAY